MVGKRGLRRAGAAQKPILLGLALSRVTARQFIAAAAAQPSLPPLPPLAPAMQQEHVLRPFELKCQTPRSDRGQRFQKPDLPK